MMTSPGITVTGADEQTSYEDLIRLARLSSRVEIGLLYTETPEGRNQYPSLNWLVGATRALQWRCAVHVCGRGARSVLLSGRDWIGRAGRVQINGVVTPDDIEAAVVAYRNCGVQFITQHNPSKNPDLSALPCVRHQLLVDASGGRGELPSGWYRPETSKPVGFAGGLGPDNLADELSHIRAVARDPWWVDMEGKLRDEQDWFLVERAERAIRAFLEATP